jgi:hypothetical protein
MIKPATGYVAGRIERSRDRYGVIHCAIDDYDWERPNDEPPLTEFYHKDRPFLYSGPYTVSCDHGCAHRPRGPAPAAETVLISRESGRGTGTHGAGPTCLGDYSIDAAADSIHKRSFAGIAACDHFFAWIEDEHCLGTLVEIGYAVALNKHIAIGSPFTLPDSGELWFALRCAETRICSKSPNDTARAWLDWLVEHEGITSEGMAA